MTEFSPSSSPAATDDDESEDEWKVTFEHNGGAIEAQHYASDAEFAAIAVFWELSLWSFPTAVVPPPLVPMMLHAAAEDPTSVAVVDCVTDVPSHIRRLVLLIPSVTPGVQRRAWHALHGFFANPRVDEHTRRFEPMRVANARNALVRVAARDGAMERADCVLAAAWGRAPDGSARFTPSVKDARTVLAVVDFFFSTPWYASHAVGTGLYAHIVAHLRSLPPPTRRRDPRRESDHADDSDDEAKPIGCETLCLYALTEAAIYGREPVQEHLISIGALDAILSRPLESLHLSTLHMILHDRGVPDAAATALITTVGRALVDRQGDEHSAPVLCAAMDGSSGRLETLFAVPGILGLLFDGRARGARRGEPCVHELAVRCCELMSDSTLAQAVAAGLLRPETLSYILGRGGSATALRNVIVKAPQYVGEAIRNGLPEHCARAMFRSYRPDHAAAAECIGTAARVCAPSDVVACMRFGVLAALADVLGKRDDALVRATVVVALCVFATRDEAAFVRKARAQAPELAAKLSRMCDVVAKGSAPPLPPGNSIGWRPDLDPDVEGTALRLSFLTDVLHGSTGKAVHPR